MQVFSLISSMLRNAPWPGPKLCPEVVPRTIRGDTLVTRSFSSAYVLVSAKPQPFQKKKKVEWNVSVEYFS
jgi:hypothetical protein